jgi:hypothetical protein
MRFMSHDIAALSSAALGGVTVVTGTDIAVRKKGISFHPCYHFFYYYPLLHIYYYSSSVVVVVVAAGLWII